MLLDEYLKMRSPNINALSSAEGKAMGVDPSQKGWTRRACMIVVPDELAAAIKSGKRGKELRAVARGINRARGIDDEGQMPLVESAQVVPTPQATVQSVPVVVREVARQPDSVPFSLVDVRREAKRERAKAKKQTKAEARAVQRSIVEASLAAVKARAGVDPREDSFLTTFAWRRLRMAAIHLHGARCMCCGASPSDGVVIHVDHIKPRKDFPELALSMKNLQIMCGACNHGKGNSFHTDYRTPAQKAAATRAENAY